ncbi:MAG: hypothetical protein AB2552_05900 [Candidatus Thiodiazotropha endolucinida]
MKDLPEKDKLLDEIVLTNELVWSKRVSKDTINDWLSNFNGEVFIKEYEEKLALWLLSNFVFYNEQEVSHLCRTIYREYLHSRLIDVTTGSIDKRLDNIYSTSMYSSLGTQGESGSMILYLFRTANGIGKRDIISNPSTIRTNTESVIFIDDVTLSTYKDSQAWQYLKKEIKKYSNYSIYLLTLIASDNAINFLKSKRINVLNAITLTNENKAFHYSSNVFNLNGDHKDNAKKFAEYYGKKCNPDDPLGHSNGQYLFGFYFNIPDNTLPIIWSKNNNWKPIFERRHKNYGKTKSDELGYFL